MSQRYSIEQQSGPERVCTYEHDFTEFIQRRNAGEKVRIDEEMAMYFLEVLPPVYMSRVVTLIDGTQVKAGFGFAEGAERITAFWWERGNWHAQHTNEIARG